MILRRLYDRPKAVLFALQPKPIKRWQRFFLGYLKPPFAVTPSLTLAEFWTKNEIKNTIVPLSTDISVFKPIDFNSKQRLKKRYALDHCEYIVSHMGHLNEKRNLKSLIPLQKSGIQVVVVTSTSSPKSDTLNSDIKQELENEGIIVFDQYMECIEEIYQISDTYVFPVIDENASIGMPLSILEARSCGIPVVSTDYGSIRYFFDYDNGAIRYSSVDNFLENCNYFLNSGKSFNDSNVRIINDKFIEVIDDYIL
jgi:glycosyltransferase involved in cell wall biosynthesis